jgi:muramoyltetrapeptide carboxypeptidase
MAQLVDSRPREQKPTAKIVPARLSPKARIGIVSPGRWMSETDLARAVSRLESFGFTTIVHEQNHRRLHQFAGSDYERAAALQSMLDDPQLDAVMFAKGGYGTLRILDLLDYKRIAQAPKVVVGYSDATALLVSLYAQANLVTYHGPMLYSLKDQIDSDTWRWFDETLVKAEQINHTFDSSSEVKVLRAGRAEGELIGGNLTLLESLIGTQADFETHGRILFIEDSDERLYKIDRMLVHLRRSGKLSGLAGLIVGQMCKISDDPVPFGYSTDEIVLQQCDGTDFPIISNFPLGHGARQFIFPIGIRAGFTAALNGEICFRLLEAPVR